MARRDLSDLDSLGPLGWLALAMAAALVIIMFTVIRFT